MANRISYSHNPAFGLKAEDLKEDEKYDILREGYAPYTLGVYEGRASNGKLKFYDNRSSRHYRFEVAPTSEMRFKLTTKWINIRISGGSRKRRSTRRSRRA